MVYGSCGLAVLAVLAACGGLDVAEQTPGGLVRQGQQVFESGDQLEQLTKDMPQAQFNPRHYGNVQDDRSDNK